MPDVIKDLGNDQYELPNGIRIVHPGGMPDRTRAILEGRMAFHRQWMAENGKTRVTTTIQDIIKIRQDPRWKNPLNEPE